jgi:antitoxin CptB
MASQGLIERANGPTSRTNMTDDTETRQRRALFRATHRGTKEMDWMLGRYATAKVMTMVGDELTRFEALILRPDPELQRWLMDAAQAPAPEVADQIAAIRAFHGTQPTKSAT